MIMKRVVPEEPLAPLVNPDDNPDIEFLVEEPLLTPAEVARMFRVDPKTVTRWSRLGWLTAIRTPGGHRRFRQAEVKRFLVNKTRG